MGKLLLSILILSILITCISCEKNHKSENPFLGIWHEYFVEVEELKSETSFYENYSWYSRSISESISDPKTYSGTYIYNDSIITHLSR